jgi:hypothetical protein
LICIAWSFLDFYPRRIHELFFRKSERIISSSAKNSYPEEKKNKLIFNEYTISYQIKDRIYSLQPHLLAADQELDWPCFASDLHQVIRARGIIKIVQGGREFLKGTHFCNDTI